MKNHLFLLISILFNSYSISGQSIIWQKTYGGSANETAYCIKQTHDKGNIIAGLANSTNGDVTGNHGWGDFWIVKIDEIGLIEWEKSFGGSGTEWATSIEQTADRGYIIAGTTQSNDGQITGNHGGDDYWIIKIDSTGILQWQKALGGSQYDEALCVKQTNDKGYIIAGETVSNDGDIIGYHGNGDGWIVKLDSAGSIQWQKTLGGSMDDNIKTLQQTNDGCYIVAGYTLSLDGDVTMNHGNYDFWIVKLDINGNVLWQKTFGGSDEEKAYSIKQTNDSGYIIAGHTRSNNGDVSGYHSGSGYDCWIIKIDSTGVLQWQKAIGGSNADEANDVTQTNDGGYVIFGETKSNDGDITFIHGNYDSWIIKLDSLGTIEWQKTLGGSNVEQGLSILQSNDGGFITAGWSNSLDGDVSGNHGNIDFWIVKLANDVGIENYKINNPIDVYPNPTKGKVSIQIPKQFGQTKTLEIFDCIGQLKLTKTDSFSDIDISSLTSGLYFIVVTNTDNERQTMKIIKD